LSYRNCSNRLAPAAKQHFAVFYCFLNSEGNIFRRRPSFLITCNSLQYVKQRSTRTLESNVFIPRSRKETPYHLWAQAALFPIYIKDDAEHHIQLCEQAS
jgi:hypothetical protein